MRAMRYVMAVSKVACSLREQYVVCRSAQTNVIA
jgi:hypothetical protein